MTTELARLRDLTNKLELEARQTETRDFKRYIQSALHVLSAMWPLLQNCRFVEADQAKIQDDSRRWIVPIASLETPIYYIEFELPEGDTSILWEVIQWWARTVEQSWRAAKVDTVILQRLRLFESLTTIVQQIGVELARADVLSVACRSIVESIEGIDRVGIVFNDNAPLTGTVVAGFPAELVGQSIQLEGYWVYEQLMKTRKPIVVNDIHEAEATLGVNRELLMRYGVKSILILPLVIQDQLIGSIGFDALEQQRTFTNAEVEVLSAVAAQIAIGLQNAQLFETLRDQSSSQQLVTQMLEALPLRSDLNTLLQTAGNQLGQVLGASRFRIQLGE